VQEPNQRAKSAIVAHPGLANVVALRVSYSIDVNGNFSFFAASSNGLVNASSVETTTLNDECGLARHPDDPRREEQWKAMLYCRTLPAYHDEVRDPIVKQITAR
jgi:hypothetical protein